MDSITDEQSSNADNRASPLDLTLLKENPQIQQLLLLALSKTNQQNEQLAPSTDNDKRKFDQLNTKANPGSLSDHSSPESDTSSDKMLGRPGRKPLTEEEIKKSDTDPKSKRKAQNRVAQRAFRERRVNYVKELEDRIKILEESQQGQSTDKKIMEENRELKKIIQQLQMENAILGGTASSFDVPLSKLTNMTNNGQTTEAVTDGRPQKLLRSIGDHPTATLFSATTPAYHYQHNDDFPSPDAKVSFALQRNSMTDGSSSSVSSKSRSLTPPDTFTGDDDILFSSATPTDILNSFDTSQLMNPFELDQDLFNTLTTTDTLIPKSPQPELSSPSSHITQSTTAPALSTQQQHSSTRPSISTITTDESSSNDLMESLLMIGDDGTGSSAEVDTNGKRQHLPSPGHNCTLDTSTLTQTWDKLTEHPRFDEFDIDLLCDEMKRKALCSNKDHEDKMKETVDKYYPSGGF
ncbi:hypothetical protein BCR42DRAFT_426733 [Absidia repens]|uniref:BZIP domain-containing protein n=1 Tax=Absidia repens TaxID=90262 RepID=A0A1X2I0W8_9FUNG|nr:hypothetical protein BCR42DRAFT_426733 [Absidia repens]